MAGFRRARCADQICCPRPVVHIDKLRDIDDLRHGLVDEFCVADSPISPIVVSSGGTYFIDSRYSARIYRYESRSRIGLQKPTDSGIRFAFSTWRYLALSILSGMRSIHRSRFLGLRFRFQYNALPRLLPTFAELDFGFADSGLRR